MSCGGVPSALAISVIFGCWSATSTCGVAVASVQPSSCSAFVVLGGQRDAVIGQDLLGEVEVFLRHHVDQHLRQFVGGEVESMPSYLFGITMSTP